MTTTQMSLLVDAHRVDRPWKVSRRTSRAAFLEAELHGMIRGRQEIVGRALRYFWNTHQRSVTSAHLAKWIRLTGKAWIGKDASWVLLETRRALSDLRRRGLVDTADRGGREFFWRWREQGILPHPIETRRTA
jgi:hypothetical protein